MGGTSVGVSGTAGYRPGEAQLAAVAARHGLGRLGAWRPLAGGVVNPVLLLNECAVLRINVREPEAPKVAKEAWVLGHVARAAGPRGPRVPRVLAADTGRAVLPYDYLLLERLPGRPGADVWPECDGTARAGLSMELGRALARLHALPLPGHRYGDWDAAAGVLGTDDDGTCQPV